MSAKSFDRIGDGPFSVTYADGVADIDLGALVDFHRQSFQPGVFGYLREDSVLEREPRWRVWSEEPAL